MSGLLTLGETLALVASTAPGSLEHADRLRLGVGGAESNVAIGVRRLGVPATWVGRVGADSLGRRVLRELRAEGVDLHGVEDPDAPTGLMVKEQRTAATARVTYYRAGSAGSRLCVDDVPGGVFGGAGAGVAVGVLHLTGITPGLSASALAATRHVLELARRAQVAVSFDVNHRDGVWRGRDPVPVYRELAAAASVVFAGEDEARLLCGLPGAAGEDELLDALAARCAGDVVLKLGARGCRALIDGVTHAVPAVPVLAVDTVGAGDAFVAGYLAELLRGLPASDRLATAVRCGAFACLTAGDWEGLPRRPDLALLDGGDPVTR